MNDDIIFGMFAGWICGVATLILILILLNNPPLFFGIALGGFLAWMLIEALRPPSYGDYL